MRPSHTPLPLAVAFAVSVLATSPSPAHASPLPDLATEAGKRRVLVLDTPDLEDPAFRAQAASLLPAWDGLLERDLRLVTREGATGFRVRLVGKDGGVKLDSSAPVSVADLFTLIDAMPMRRAEQRMQ